MSFEEFLEEWRNEETVIRVKTSGSTGSPKIISLDKEFVRAGAVRTNSFFSIDAGSRLHSCISADFIGGKMMGVRSEVSGCRLSWETPSNQPLSTLGKDEVIDLLAVVPSQILHIISNLENMPEIRAVIIGGSAIHPGLRKKIISTGINAFETYGMTETASHIALRKVEEGEEFFSVLPGISVSLDNRECLVIKFESGEKIITNDLAVVADPGRFKIIGRFDNVIISGGKKVNPEDVERRISALIKGDYLITSRPDEKWGERVVLLIEGEKDNYDGNLMATLKKLLNPFEVPKEIEWVSQLKRTPNGKIIRKI